MTDDIIDLAPFGPFTGTEPPKGFGFFGWAYGLDEEYLATLEAAEITRQEHTFRTDAYEFRGRVVEVSDKSGDPDAHILRIELTDGTWKRLA